MPNPTISSQPVSSARTAYQNYYNRPRAPVSNALQEYMSQLNMNAGTGRRYRASPSFQFKVLQYKNWQEASKKLMGTMQTAYDEAKAANLQRYGQIMQGYDTLYGKTMGSFDTTGSQARIDIADAYRRNTATGMQNLVSSGMYGTTTASALNIQAGRGEAAENARLTERLAEAKRTAMVQQKTGKLDFMERREDTYPNYGQYAQLIAGGLAS